MSVTYALSSNFLMCACSNALPQRTIDLLTADGLILSALAREAQLTPDVLTPYTEAFPWTHLSVYLLDKPERTREHNAGAARNGSESTTNKRSPR